VTDLRASMKQAGDSPPDVARLLEVPLRTVENWLSPGHPAQIRPAMLLLYRHKAGLERIPFRAKTSGTA
jgi:hypothetical protein